MHTSTIAQLQATSSKEMATKSTLLSPVPTQTSPVSTQSGEALSPYISVGVSGVVVVLVAAAVIVISVTVCLRKRKHVNKLLTDNVARGTSGEMELSTNTAYNATCDSTRLQNKADIHSYDYIATTDVSIITAPNKAYVKTSIPVSSNQAYGMMEHHYD